MDDKTTIHILAPDEMWATYIRWLKSRSGMLTNRQVDAFFATHGWTYLKLRNAMNPGLYKV